MPIKATQNEVIERFTKIHGEQYDYSLVKYEGMCKNVLMICKLHGEFSQKPFNHLKGHGCAECGKIKGKIALSLSLDDLILKFDEIFNNKYNYSKTIYVNCETDIEIECNLHGTFKKNIYSHLNGHGCRECDKETHITKNRYTTTIFIEKAISIFGDLYDYSKVDYIKAHDYVCIICNTHGEFWQKPYIHLQNHGCFKCMVDSHKKDLEFFINKGNKIHNFKYDYSKSIYTNTHSEIIIICPLHGEFSQTPNSHLDGKGCMECYRKSRRLLLTDVINRANEIHNNKYNYSKTIYINTYTNITIVCPIHGDFEQLPSNHLFGRGCPKCNQSHGEREITKFLDKYNIRYVKNKRFNSCVYKRELRFDFYLIDFDILIEYDGIQHFIPNDRFGGQKMFDYRTICDNIKNEWVITENKKLIRIPYWDFSNIENILTEELL